MANQQKCPPCFRKDECMLFLERHAGVENCLGPFKDQEDRMQRIREAFAHEEKRADLDKVERDIALNAFQRKKKLFDE